MAAPITTATKRKSTGPRQVKDKVVYALFKGSMESLSIVDNAEAALDAKEADPSLTYKKIVIPVKRRAPVAPPTQPSA